jgi:hypothetical protein
MEERKFVYRQFFKANDRGLSKYHIFEVDEDGYVRVAICGARGRRGEDVRHRSPRTIEKVLNNSSYLFKRYNNKQPCKRCLDAAQKIRCPLQRLAQIKTSE